MLGRDLAGTDATLFCCCISGPIFIDPSRWLFIRVCSRMLHSAESPLELPACPHVPLTHGDAETPRPRSSSG